MSKEFKTGDFVWVITYEGESPLTPVFAKIVNIPTFTDVTNKYNNRNSVINKNYFFVLIDGVNVVVKEKSLFKTKEKAFIEWKKLANNYVEKIETKLERIKNNLAILSDLENKYEE